MLDLSVIILTHNEERHIARALDCLRPIASRVVIVDSFSSDKTVAIAEAGGAIVLQNKFVNYAKQFEWALANAPIETTWVMRLDADEVIEPDLAAEIQAKLPGLGADIAGINLKRKHIFMDRWVRHGGRFPLVLLRIWRHGQGRIEQRWMDEHMVVWGGKTVTFDGGFADHNLNDLTFFTDKHNKYATREAIDILNQKYEMFQLDDAMSARAASFQASMKRVVKERIYNQMPFWLGPMCYFLYRYFIQLGFLDGRAGLIYHFLQGGWYRFLVGAKVVEYDQWLAPLPDAQERAKMLEKLTGHKLVS